MSKSSHFDYAKQLFSLKNSPKTITTTMQPKEIFLIAEGKYKLYRSGTTTKPSLWVNQVLQLITPLHVRILLITFARLGGKYMHSYHTFIYIHVWLVVHTHNIMSLYLCMYVQACISVRRYPHVHINIHIHAQTYVLDIICITRARACDHACTYVCTHSLETKAEQERKVFWRSSGCHA